MKKRVGIVILATNVYFVLGLRFMKRFIHFYRGDCEIVFYFFSDEDPTPYIPENIKVKFYKQTHRDWRAGTNSKFKNIVNIQYDLKKDVDYVYYFDADTNVNKEFTEDWFMGEYVSGEHYGNKGWLANGAGFDRSPIGKSYVPISSNLPYTYRYGAFFGGSVESMLFMCQKLMEWQIIDTDKGYEPPNNDEGYLNCYFHFNTPTLTVPSDKFEFLISDKGGLEEVVRHPETDISAMKKELLENKDQLFNIVYKNIVYNE